MLPLVRANAAALATIAASRVRARSTVEVSSSIRGEDERG